MTGTAVANARLVEVRSSGSGDGYGSGTTEGAPGPAKWQGWAGCFYEETRQRRVGERTDVHVWRTLEIPSGLRGRGAPHDPLRIEAGDSVVFRRDGEPENETGKVQAVEGDPTVRGVAGTLRLTLEGE